MNTARDSEATDVGQQRLALIVEGITPIGSLHAAAGIELWPPAALMPTVHSIDTLFPALGDLFDQHSIAL